MIRTVEQMINDIDHGVYDFTKDGKCSQCGNCCSDLLWLSEKEIKEIKSYIKKNKIEEQKHTVPAPVSNPPIADLTCPFLNMNKKDEKCVIYPVRPLICKCFMCNEPDGAKNHPKLYEERRNLISMRAVFFGDGKEKNHGSN